MRRLILLVLILIVLGFVGWLVYLNEHKVSIFFSPSYTIQVSLWGVISGTFVVGYLMAILKRLLFNADGLVAQIKHGFKQRAIDKFNNSINEYFEAYRRGDIEAANKAFFVLQSTDYLPLFVRVSNLKLGGLNRDYDQIMSAFEKLSVEFSRNLVLLLPKLKLLLEFEHYFEAETICHEILAIQALHPRALLGLIDCCEHRKGWLDALKYEQLFLKHYPKSMYVDKVTKAQVKHQFLAISSNSLNRIDNNRDLFNPKFLSDNPQFEAVLKANSEEAKGNFLKAAKSLENAYKKTGAPFLLDKLEALYYSSANNIKVLDSFSHIRQSKATSLNVELTLAKIYYKEKSFSELEGSLNYMSSQFSVENSKIYHLLNHLLSEHNKEAQKSLSSLKKITLVNELLKKPYTCSSCAKTSEWMFICSACNNVNTLELT